MNARCSRPLMVALLALALVPDNSTSGDVLMYSDQSPGALPFYVLTKACADHQSEALTLTTTASAFEQKLAGATSWSAVIVAARFTPGDPPFIQALRDYAALHMETPIDFYYWHDNGTSPTADKAVLGTTAAVLWRSGRTTIGYAFAKSAPETASVSGLQLPVFENVTRVAPDVIARIADPQGMSTAQMIAALIAVLQTDTCRAQCLLEWRNNRQICTDKFVRQEGQCTALYNTPPDHVNPEKYTECSNKAAEHRVNCNNSALTTYQNCVKLCDQDDPPQ